MKKIALITLLFIFAFSYAEAQSRKVKKFSDDLCGCINKTFGNLHPALLQMFSDMADYGEEKAKDNLIAYLQAHPEEAEAFQQSMTEMGNVEEKMEKNCSDLKDKYKNLDKEFSAEGKEKAIQYIKKKKDCKIGFSKKKA
jgi:hypothetical protein